MAVQAHHPSNVFFLNRDEKEGENLSFQPQDYLDQTDMLNNGDRNPRKRERNSTADEMNSHQFSFQSQTPQVIDLSLLHNQHYQQPPPTSIVFTGLRLSSGEGQPQSFNSRVHVHQQQYRHEENHRDFASTSFSSGLVSVLSEDFAAQINRQRQELDEYLHSQAEELRRTLAEKRRRHYSALLRAVEEPFTRKLREKEVEVLRATRRRQELEARTVQLTAEVQTWQAKARAHEAAAASLEAQLRQAVHDNKAEEEGLSCAADAGTEDAESAYVDPERMMEVRTLSPSCKSCRRKAATVLLLPCRHLSLCPECDRSASACSVCFTPKSSSVEVLL